ncbi:Helicase swr1 [Neolecta irregularis DAH-3]|uniref:DNA helicase n=1 Tax=Neolecta irregularis (strain DAH-3) TaxID=1198029 RepID=A0A1U7LTM9_NEOID|nr:Helicase swr1 [Neolecta irregularis DAH-3]|eukprot:OLL25871.1 Helicase swr1 [Neolecta irregularis DAH-3]
MPLDPTVHKNGIEISTVQTKRVIPQLPLPPNKRPKNTTAQEPTIDHVRQNTIADKQREIQRIVEDQDDQVRRLFHADKFVTFTDYNPLIAKEDQSDVFEQFASRYDMFERLADERSGGRTRPTRSMLNAQRKSLVNGTTLGSNVSLPQTIVLLPQLSHPMTVEDSEQPLKKRSGSLRKSLQSEHISEISRKKERSEAVQPSPLQKSQLQAMKHGRGRPKIGYGINAPPAEKPPGTNGSSRSLTETRGKRGPGRPRKNLRVLDTADEELSESASEESQDIGAAHPPRNRSRERPTMKENIVTGFIGILPSDGSATSVPTTRRPGRLKISVDSETYSHSVNNIPVESFRYPVDRGSKLPVKATKDRNPDPVETSEQEDEETSEDEHSSLLSVSTLPGPDLHEEPPSENFVRPRIKVLFTLSKPIITHPVQVPEAKKFATLNDFLESYIALDDDLSPEEAQSRVEKEAHTHIRIRIAKSKGWLSEDRLDISVLKKEPEIPREPDLYDNLVSQATMAGKVYLHNRKFGISQCRKISNTVTNHFKRLEGADEKEKKELERRMKQLARRTAFEVRRKWKLVDKEVRRLRMAEIEEHQRKEGKKHLNQILERSEALLAAQHGSGEVSEEEEMTEEEDKVESFPDDQLSDDSIEVTSEHEDDQLTTEELRRKYSEIPDVHTPMEEETLDVEDDRPLVMTKAVVLEQSVIVSPKQVSDSKSQRTIDDEDEAHTDSADVDVDLESDKVGGLAALYENAIQQSLKSHTSTENLEEVDQSSAMDSEADTPDYMSDDAPGLNYLYGGSTTADPHILEVQTQGDENSCPASPSLENQFPQVSDSKISTPNQDMMTTTSALKTGIPHLLRGTLREYQHIGLDWLAGLHNSDTNGILADEMGLGYEFFLRSELKTRKTIQTISLLAYLACEKHIWGPHLIVVPTSVILNWEVEFKKFAPGFKILTYYGSQNQRREKRKGWNKEDTWHVCITSYQICLQDQAQLKRKRWEYLILDEAHNIKNFRSQRWQTLLSFNTVHRLLLTGTPLQNNLVELWSLLYFLMPQGLSKRMPSGFANLKEFQEWFAHPVDKMIENESEMDEESKNTVAKLHKVLRPYLLRRLKADVEKQMPAKYEHVVYCRLSKRQRFLYDDFLNRGQTKETLQSGNYLSIINCLMQLRKVCNHPDLFETRPIVTSLAMSRSVVADFEINSLFIRRRLLMEDSSDKLDLDFLNLVITENEDLDFFSAIDRVKLSCDYQIATELNKVQSTIDWSMTPGYETLEKHRSFRKMLTRLELLGRLRHSLYLNHQRTQKVPIYGSGLIKMCREPSKADVGLSAMVKQFDESYDALWNQTSLRDLLWTNEERAEDLDLIIQKFAFVTPKVVALDMPALSLSGISQEYLEPHREDSTLHQAAVRLSIAFPDKRLLQFDCGKLQRLDALLRELKAENHRVLIFTQMTRVLDILEQFLNIHGHLYARLDGSTKIEQRQILTERRSGGLGINLTGADTVIFYDSDWNPCMDRQCQDRCHRIGQTRDVHIYRLVSEYTIEENMLKKANQKRLLDNMVITEGQFTTDYFNKVDWRDMFGPEFNLDERHQASGPIMEKALAAAEDDEDATAARVAQGEIDADAIDFDENSKVVKEDDPQVSQSNVEDTEDQNEPGHVDDYILRFLQREGLIAEW